MHAHRMITGPHFYEGLPLQSLAYRYPLLLVCWRQRLHCSSRLFCIVNISSEQCVQLFVLFNLALKKCSMDKFQVSVTDPAEWEGSSAGAVKGENCLYPFFLNFDFYTFPFRRTPEAWHLPLSFTGSNAGHTQLSPGQRNPLRNSWIRWTGNL